MIYRPAGEPFQQSICWMRFFPPFKGFGKSSLPGKNPGRTMSMYYWRRVIKRYNHGSTGGRPHHADMYLSCQCQRNKISVARRGVIPLRSDSELSAAWIHGKYFINHLCADWQWKSSSLNLWLQRCLWSKWSVGRRRVINLSLGRAA